MPVVLTSPPLPPGPKGNRCADSVVWLRTHVLQHSERLLVQQAGAAFSVEAPPLSVFRGLLAAASALLLRSAPSFEVFVGGPTAARLRLNAREGRWQVEVEGTGLPRTRPVLFDIKTLLADVSAAALEWRKGRRALVDKIAPGLGLVFGATVADLDALPHAAKAGETPGRAAAAFVAPKDLRQLEAASSFSEAFKLATGAVWPLAEATLGAKREGLCTFAPLRPDLEAPPPQRLARWLNDVRTVDKAHYVCFEGSRLIAVRKDRDLLTLFEDSWRAAEPEFFFAPALVPRLELFWKRTAGFSDGFVVRYGEVEPAF